MSSFFKTNAVFISPDNKGSQNTDSNLSKRSADKLKNTRRSEKESQLQILESETKENLSTLRSDKSMVDFNPISVNKLNYKEGLTSDFKFEPFFSKADFIFIICFLAISWFG